MMGRMTAAVASHELYTKHADTLQRALTAIAERGYWSAFPESPSPRVYGESAAPAGEAAFRAYLGSDFPLDQPGVDGHVATESSPFGIPLDVRYPHSSPDALIAAATAALPAWRDAGPATRAGVCLEILGRLHEHIFELANAVQFTTGQAFVMAFQAGGAHALDRALEALAYAYAEQTRQPAQARWEKPAGKGEPLRMTKTFHVVPRGVALVIGCNTFPTWNSYPGLFASLATGNPVIVKPHPRAVLPLAVTVRYAREALAEAGFDPNLVQLAAEAPDEKLASTLALRPEVKIIDFTGSTQYGDWLEEHARQAFVYTEKAGVNTVIVDSTDDFAGMCRNLAFSLTLYSGQMCTTPQNVLIAREGIHTEGGHKAFVEVAQGIADAIEGEWFGPITFLVATDSTVDSVALFRRIVGAKGGLTASVYSTSPEVLDDVERAALDVGVHLSANLTGGVFVNQSAAFSDFHATGANPAANATLTDGAYVANRFRV